MQGHGYVFVSGFFRVWGYHKANPESSRWWHTLGGHHISTKPYCIKPKQKLTLLHVDENYEKLSPKQLPPCFDGWFNHLGRIYLADMKKITIAKCPNLEARMTLDNALVHFYYSDRKINVFNFEQKVHIATFRHPFMIQLSKNNRAFRVRLYSPGDQVLILKKGETFRLAMSAFSPTSISPSLYDAFETFDAVDFELGELIEKFEPYDGKELEGSSLYDYQIYTNGVLAQDGMRVFEYIGISNIWADDNRHFHRLDGFGKTKVFWCQIYDHFRYRLAKPIMIQQCSPLGTNFYLKCDGYLENEKDDGSIITTEKPVYVDGEYVGTYIRTCWLYRKGKYYLDEECDGRDTTLKPMERPIATILEEEYNFDNPVVEEIVENIPDVVEIGRRVGNYGINSQNMSIYDSQGFIKRFKTYDFVYDDMKYRVQVVNRTDTPTEIIYDLLITLYHKYLNVEEKCECTVALVKDWKYPNEAIRIISERLHRDPILDEDSSSSSEDQNFGEQNFGESDSEDDLRYQMYADKHSKLELSFEGKVTEIGWYILKYLDSRLLKALALTRRVWW